MIYITGKKDTIDHLMKIDGYDGPSAEYKKKLLALNPHLTDSPHPKPYTPLCLIKDSSEEIQGIARELNDSILEIREHLWTLQSESRLDANAIAAVFETMDEYQEYQKKSLRRSIGSILIFALFVLAFVAYVLIRQ
jgi:hypothetical protein